METRSWIDHAKNKWFTVDGFIWNASVNQTMQNFFDRNWEKLIVRAYRAKKDCYNHISLKCKVCHQGVDGYADDETARANLRRFCLVEA